MLYILFLKSIVSHNWLIKLDEIPKLHRTEYFDRTHATASIFNTLLHENGVQTLYDV